MAAPAASTESQASGGPQPPACLLVLGMAGSGKTTFVQRLTGYLHSQGCPPYVINLDPAVHEVPFPANIAFLMMYSAYKLNKQGDNIQP
ncbi:hypothetical protein FD754_006007 [Muntiacus muntjak]|uniref:GPN-loop GTPase n=1 Tax=Muntiacus muntjak TaxID=9888 RepID=A0A5N3WJC2_MUNMU|nr:hypothetical protein FD754_006007 [Muntiacus muntjak]